MTTIQKLEFILNAYKKALLEVKGDYERKMDKLRFLDMQLGICNFCEYSDIDIDLPSYIIKRNLRIHSVHWVDTPLSYWFQDKDPMEGIIQRIIILEKELKHHKKWRFLAKYIKP